MLSKAGDTITGQMVDGNALLARSGPEARAELEQLARRRLEKMYGDNLLHYPEPGPGEFGIFEPWKESDGSELQCWLDILGLNHRPIKETRNSSSSRTRGVPRPS